MRMDIQSVPTSREGTPATNEPVAVIGAGPVGLAAAAHLAERGMDFVVLEEGNSPGAAIEHWGHVRLFSPWRFDVDSAARRLLEADGWIAPNPDELPTGAELVGGYLAPLAKLPSLASRIRYWARVEAITRLGFDRVRSAGRESAPFLLRLTGGEEVVARAVIDGSGTWRTPNTLGAYGLLAHGEVPGTQAVWAIRGGNPRRAFGGGEADALPARGALGARLRKLVDSGAVELVTGFH